MCPAGIGCLRLDHKTEALSLLPDLQKGLNALRRDLGGTVDMSIRFLNHFAGAGLLFPGETLTDERVLEVVNFDPVMNNLVVAGEASPYPWAAFHWLVLRTCPEHSCVVQVYDDPAAAGQFPLDAQGIEKLEGTLREIRDGRFIAVDGIGAIAVGTGMIETVGTVNRKLGDGT